MSLGSTESSDHFRELSDTANPDQTFLDSFKEATKHLAIDNSLESYETTENAVENPEPDVPSTHLVTSDGTASKNTADAPLRFPPIVQIDEKQPRSEGLSSSIPVEEGSGEVQSGPQAPFVVAGFASRAVLARWFPQIDDDESKSWRIWMSKRSRALLLHTGIVAAILLTIFILTLWAAVHYPHSHGVSTLYQGSCALVKRLDLWLHLLINVLSTGMLMASNYCMQLQAAPTRKECRQSPQSPGLARYWCTKSAKSEIHQ